MSSPRIDLVWLGAAPPPRWQVGEVLRCEAEVGPLAAWMDRLAGNAAADGFLFWASDLPLPSPDLVLRTFALPGDLWHAGLRLGQSGLPGTIDFVWPTWMLNRDPDPGILATSWRLSLRSCLMRSEVLRRLGGLRSDFRSLEIASLELGHRYIMRGALARHVPSLLPGGTAAPPSAPSLEDELRFIYHRFGKFWTRWCALRAVRTRYASARSVVKALRSVISRGRPAEPPPLRSEPLDLSQADGQARVTVLIPTLDRYTFLRPLLHQLRSQTIRPLEILVIDQTPAHRRADTLEQEFPDLPLSVVFRDRAGQCSSRNAGLLQAEGDYVLFLDDDDEVPPDLIARHLASLARHRAEVSCGVAEETGAGPLPEAFRLARASDVFPTNNVLIRRDILQHSGLFDLAYERGARADRDLGMRIYLSGALMVLHPEIPVVHHHAPSGGLRAHGARVVTYASSASRLTHRHLPSATEIYLARRYFTPRQVRESVWRRAVSTLSARGGPIRRLAKLLLGIVLLPDTFVSIRRSSREAAELARRYPEIPFPPPSPGNQKGRASA
ncbi:MAG: glycosyltransferase family 2 protein [Thermoanaerobaculia bacterium]